MKKRQVKEELWHELDDDQAEIISGGLQRLQEEFAVELSIYSKSKEIVVVGSKIP